jgi:hypothetical protein
MEKGEKRKEKERKANRKSERRNHIERRAEEKIGGADGTEELLDGESVESSHRKASKEDSVGSKKVYFEKREKMKGLHIFFIDFLTLG